MNSAIGTRPVNIRGFGYHHTEVWYLGEKKGL